MIAEGVESITHALILLCMGCKIAQGYAIAKPMPADEVINWSYNFCMPKRLLIEHQKNNSLRTSQFRLLIHFLELEFTFFKNHIHSVNHFYNKHLPSSQSHCGFWLKKAKSIQFIEAGLLEALENEYSQLLKSVSNVCVLYQCGDVTSAKLAFKDVEMAYTSLIEKVNQHIAI